MTPKIQIDDLVRDATPDEIATMKERDALDDAALEKLEAQKSAAMSARAKLAKLGLTDDELKALLGV